eukprot:scaffold166451_cov62-Attheya_sp.AAC.3
MVGKYVTQPDAGVTVYSRTPTYYDELDGPPPPPARLDIPDLVRQYRASDCEGYFGSGCKRECNFLADPMEIPAETPGLPSEYITDHHVTDFPIPNWGAEMMDR